MSGHLRTPWDVLRDTSLKGQYRWVLQVILSRVGTDGFQLGRKRIAKEADVSTKTVQRAVAVLVERGLLVVEKRFKDREQEADFFRAGPVWLAACEAGGCGLTVQGVWTESPGGVDSQSTEVVTPEVVTSEVVPPPPPPHDPVVASGGRAAEEEEEAASRDVMDNRVSSRGPIPDALARQKGFTSGEEAGRFFAEVYPDVDNPVAFLRAVRDRERWQQQVEDWREEAERAVREVYVTDLAVWTGLAMGLPVDGVRQPRRLLGPRSDEREPNLATYAWLRDHGWSAQDLVDRMLAEPVHEYARDMLSVTEWLADLRDSGEMPQHTPSLAEPAVPDSPSEQPHSEEQDVKHETEYEPEWWPPLRAVDWGF